MVDELNVRDEVIVAGPGPSDTAALVEMDLKYEGYVERAREAAATMARMEDVRIPSDFDFEALNALSLEAREKLGRIRPDNLGQASRVSGVRAASRS